MKKQITTAINRWLKKVEKAGNNTNATVDSTENYVEFRFDGDIYDLINGYLNDGGALGIFECETLGRSFENLLQKHGGEFITSSIVRFYGVD